MITPKALHKARILIFWEKHGLTAALDAFSVKRSTLFLWKQQFITGGKKAEALNEKKRTPRNRRKRLWPEPVITEIKRQRALHPNIGKDKLHVLLAPFCVKNNQSLPSVSTIGRIIKDCGGLRGIPSESASQREDRARKA